MHDDEAVEYFLQYLDTWEQAYPLKCFPEPDLERAHEVLKEAGMTLDALTASTSRYVVSHIAPKARAAIEALARTLPPANTEADVERVAADLCNDQAAREHAGQTDAPAFEDSEPHVQEYWRLIAKSALSLTRPAGGEEVRAAFLEGLAMPGPSGNPRRAEEIWKNSASFAALTKPPALPKEGEAWQRDHVAPYDTPVVVKWDWDAELRERLAVRLTLGLGVDGWFEYPGGALDRPTHWKRDPALSSLPVRSGEVEAAMAKCTGLESGPNGRGEMRVVAHFPVGEEAALFSLLNAALATPQQVNDHG